MSLKFSYVMSKNDWIKLAILLLVGGISIGVLYREYSQTVQEYNTTISSIERQ